MTEIINHLLERGEYERLLSALVSWGLVCPQYAATLSIEELRLIDWEEFVGEALLDEMF